MTKAIALRDSVNGRIYSSDTLLLHSDLAASIGRADVGDRLHPGWLIDGVFIIQRSLLLRKGATKMMPLSEPHEEEIQRASALLPPHLRHNFIRLTMNKLEECPRCNNFTVQWAISHALAEYGVALGRNNNKRQRSFDNASENQRR
jgi:hypothetical protein